jgi:SNF2 family DNA or RNA helicase
VGQKKNVTIYRFLCQNTIEERIEQIQQKKIEIAQRVCSASVANIPGMASAGGNSRLNENDWKLLFQDFD